MTEYSKSELQDIVREALRDVMAEKIELTFGVNCRDPKDREAVSDDMKFLRTLRTQTQKGGEKIFWWAIGLIGTGVIAWFWPELTKIDK